MFTPIPMVFDMETQDPDDYLTLLLLLGHPRVELKAVTITPGSAQQVGLVRRTLELFGKDIPVGARNIDHPKPCVSSWHPRAYGEIEPSRDAEPAAEVLHAMCDEETTLLTGAPVKNLGAALEIPGFCVGRWVAQGGFAGEGVVPEEKQLAKFKGLVTCPTFNLTGAPREAMRALHHEGIGEKRFVSKNVCHGVVYNRQMHQELAPIVERSGSLSLAMIWQGMDAYLKKKAAQLFDQHIEADEVRVRAADGEMLGVMSTEEGIALAREAGLSLVQVSNKGAPPVCKLLPTPDASQIGKKFHDPLAACCAIDPEVGQWAEVQLYREKGRWGSQLAEGTDTWIIVDYDHRRFLEVLTAHHG